MSGNLEDILNSVFLKKKRERINPLKKPILSTKTKTANIDLYDKQIFINPEFVKRLSKVLSYDDIFEALLEHEMEHYFFLPYDLTTAIFENTVLKDVPEKKRKLIINLYNDIVVNTYISLKNPRVGSNIAKIYENTGFSDSKAGKLILALYTNITGINFGSSNNLDSELLKKLEFLKRIDYLSTDKESIRENLIIFARTLSDILDDEDSNLESDEVIIKNAKQSDIDKALKELTKVLSLEEYKFAYSFIKENFSENKSVEDSIFDYYLTKAKTYSIHIVGREFIALGYGKGERKQWNPSDSPKYIDMTRGNKYPLISTRKKEKALTYGEKTKVPDCLIVIDSSGSMKSPEKDSYAIVAAMAVARQYFLNNAKVDVINFSSQPIITKYKDEITTYKAIFNFQGNDTKFPTREVLDLSKDKDIVIITDGLIPEEEAKTFLNELNKKALKNRIVFIHINTSGNAQDYYKYKNEYSRIIFEFISDEREIPKIVIRDTKYS